MRARLPDQVGSIDHEGVEIAFEVYGNGRSTVVLVPTWSLFHSRVWKMQIAYLARHFRVVTYDPRGNGRSDRPVGTENHGWRQYVGDLLAVMDATLTERATLVGLSISSYWCNVAAVRHPARVNGVVAIAPVAGLGIVLPERVEHSYTERVDSTDGWAKENVHFIRARYRDYVEFFVGKIFSELHSTKQTEDGVRWGLETDPETLIASDTADILVSDDMAAFYSRYPAPLLIIQGNRDAIVSFDSSVELARLTGGTLVALEGSGHAPNLRDPVKVNLLIRDFVERVAA